MKFLNGGYREGGAYPKKLILAPSYPKSLALRDSRPKKPCPHKGYRPCGDKE